MNKYAASSTTELKEQRERVLAAKRSNAQLWAIAESDVGQMLLQRRHDELEAVRKTYLQISTDGRDPHEVIRELIARQVQERFILKEVEQFDFARHNAETLDNELKFIDDALRMKEESAKKRR